MIVQPRADGDQERALRLFVALVLALSAGRYLHLVVKFFVEGLFIDFAHYYVYTRAVATGINPFDAAAVARLDAELGIRRALGAADYPPLFYLLMRPWTLLPYWAASRLWLLVNQACLGGAMLLVVRHYGPVTPVRLAAVWFVVLNFQPLIESVALGQSNTLLLLLVTAAWFAARRGAPWLAGVPLAVAVHVKPQYAALVVLIWAAGARAAALAAVGLAAFGWAVALAVTGPAHVLDYARHVASLPDGLIGWSMNLSVRGVLHRVLSPLDGGPALAHGLTLALDVTLLVLVVWALTRSAAAPGLDDWKWALGATLVPLLSPFTEEHHLVLLLFPLAVLLLTAAPRRPSLDAGLVLAGALLVATRYSLERFPQMQAGLPALLTAGKIAGTGMLGLALGRRILDARRGGGAPP